MMSIFEQINTVLAKQDKMLFTRKEILDLVSSEYGTNRKSIIPSDYCYNRINVGIDFTKHCLVRLSPGEYKYVGEGYPYNGWIYRKAKETTGDEIAGEWKNGKCELYDLDGTSSIELDPPILQQKSKLKLIGIDQIQKLYEEYLELLQLEVQVFGCKPTETRHLIGRIGEFKAAVETNGALASRTNQHGFDVIAGNGKKISVKTTAQDDIGFVAINTNTVGLVDELMIIQYQFGDFIIIYHDDINQAIKHSRRTLKTWELDIYKAKKISSLLNKDEKR